MKRKISFIVLIIISLVFIQNVNAEDENTCKSSSKTAIQKAAAKVKASYDIMNNADNSNYFLMSVYNITDEVYVEITNNINDEDIKVYYSDSNNGTYNFRVDDTVTIITYTISIKATKYGCSGTMKKLTLIKPKYNDISELTICQNEEVVDSTYCKPWITKYFSYTREEIIEKINAQYEKKKSTTTTACITCEEEANNQLALKRANRIRIAIIMGLVTGIILDLIFIGYTIYKLKRYEI